MYMLIKINFVSNIAHIIMFGCTMNKFGKFKVSSYKKISLRENKPLVHYSTDIHTLNLLIRILENKVTCIIYTLSYTPKVCFSMYL